MNLKELFEKHRSHRTIIFKRLYEMYDDQEKSSEAYEKVFRTLLVMEPKETDMKLYIEFTTENYGEFIESWDHVYGKNGKTFAEEFKHDNNGDDEITWSLASQKWNVWLGMEIDETVLENYSEFEILAHCMFEMSFFGFDEGTIQSELDCIVDEKCKLVQEFKDASTAAG